jgi:bifunctional non-homologous end joining protein LigD
MAHAIADSLKAYLEKRDFKSTPEPRGRRKAGKGRLFVIQKHDATRLHYDFRLELDGVLKSWAVTKGPSLNPDDKRLAVQVEDHPLDYAKFEGTIPKGQYGGGTVMLWDIGSWTPEGDPHEGLRKGKLSFTLDGARLKGGFTLVRMRFDRNGGKSKRANWLLIKRGDEEASESLDPTEKYETSVKSKRSMAAIAKGNKVWQSNRTRKDANPARGENIRQPAFVPPQLAVLEDKPPEGKNWIHEIKFDGYRLIVSLARDSVRLFTRSGKDWTAKFGSLESAFSKLDAHALIDGEAVVYDTAGRSSFQALQKALSEGDDRAIKFVAFDLLFLDGVDLRRQPLEDRKKKLKALLKKPPEGIIYSEHLPGTVHNVLEHACKLGAEGLVSKDRTATYVSRRDASWIKSKCTGRSEFVIGGYRPSDKKSRPFASLLIGENGPDGLIYRGRVGAGFDEDGLAEMGDELRKRESRSSPFIKVPRDIVRKARWVKPELVAEIAFTEMTSDGHMRHPVFMGLREDKAATEVTGEDRHANKPKKGNKEGEHAGVRLTHPDRVFYPADGLTKRELAAYLEKAAPRMLEHVSGHPLSLVRCPDGIAAKCFFQKHVSAGMPPAFKTVPIREKDGGIEDYIYVDSAEGIISAAQIGALELHVWGSPSDDIEHPDRMVFDLDPSPEVGFKTVRQAAKDVAAVLKKAGLDSYPLVTGGKGVHVIVPLSGKNDWEDVKNFSSNFAKGLAVAAPDRFIATASKEKRKGLIFIDWLRNERGATAIAPYSPRARKGAAVAMPLSWPELARVKSAAAFNTKNAVARLKKDPWPDWKKKQTISREAIASAEAAAAK